MQTLHPHPAVSAPEVTITASAERTGPGALRLAYAVGGDTAAVRWPAAGAGGGRADGLWRSTCLEAFVAPAGGAGYAELNFAPAGDWAAYRFSGPRAGMAELPCPPPVLTTEAGEGALRLTAEVDLSQAAAFLGRRWRVGLTAVIEDTTGRLSYWALRHPAGKPDFHHPDSFVLELPEPA